MTNKKIAIILLIILFIIFIQLSVLWMTWKSFILCALWGMCVQIQTYLDLWRSGKLKK